MNKTYIIGDIHGMYDKLIACLQAVNFDYNNDTLIQLGDVVDRGPKSFECIEELLKIKNLIAIKGNHDHEFHEGLKTGSYNLFTQGAKETCMSYIRNLDIGDSTIPEDLSFYHIPTNHYNFFISLLPYYIDKDNNLFIHGGYNRHYLIEEEKDIEVFWWDRDLLHSARSYATMKHNEEHPFKMKNNFKNVFIGHTPVQYFNETTPQKYANIWLLDTGAGKSSSGTVTIMDLETKEFKQF